MKQNLTTVAIFTVISLILIISLSSSMFLTVDAGERGVMFRPFNGGLDKDKVYSPGFHVIAPWNDMYVYDVREKQLEESMTVLSNDGLDIKLDVTIRVNPMHGKIGKLHEMFGKDYLTSLVKPEVRSSVRKIIGRYKPEELYSSKRDEVQTLIQKDLEESLVKNYIELRATLIRDVALPEKVKAAIEDKIEAEQQALKYQYTLQKERKEAERKVIEAQAKADANRILNASLTTNILKDKGIEATLKLSNSPNTKVIVVGGGGDGLPLILGNN